MSKSPVKFVDDEEEAQDQKRVNQVNDQESKTPNYEHEMNNYFQVRLPSKGDLGYPSVLEYRDVVYGDEIKIKMATSDTYIRTVNKVLKGIVNNPSFYDDICTYDRDHLLLWTFANSYTPKQEMEMDCIYCDHKNSVTVDLTELEVNDIRDDTPVPFKMDLKTGDTIYVHLPRVRDELIADSMTQNSDNQSLAFDDYIIQSAIDIEGKQFKKNQEKFEWIETNISAKEMSVIKRFHERFAFGVNDIIEKECENCGELNRGRFPFRVENFFISTGSDDDLEYYLQLNKES